MLEPKIWNIDYDKLNYGSKKARHGATLKQIESDIHKHVCDQCF